MNIYRFVQVIPDDTFVQLKMLQFWSWFVVKLFRFGSPYWVSKRSDCILSVINAFFLWSFIFLSSHVRYFPKTTSSSLISFVWGLFFKSARTETASAITASAPDFFFRMTLLRVSIHVLSASLWLSDMVSSSIWLSTSYLNNGKNCLLQMPDTSEAWDKIAQQFEGKCIFLNCIAAWETSSILGRNKHVLYLS